MNSMLKAGAPDGALMALAICGCLAGCATTVHDRGVEETPWRAEGWSAEPQSTSPPATASVYVASFGLAKSVAQRHPELVEGTAGLGISQRIAESLFASGYFVLREDKAEVVERIAGLLRGESAVDEDATDLPPVEWLLYGELLSLETRVHESVSGLRATTELETRVEVQIRLLDRATREFLPATAIGVERSRWRASQGEIDPRAVSLATESAVGQAITQLTSKLEGRSRAGDAAKPVPSARRATVPSSATGADGSDFQQLRVLGASRNRNR